MIGFAGCGRTEPNGQSFFASFFSKKEALASLASWRRGSDAQAA
jgi:hypothetical protein